MPPIRKQASQKLTEQEGRILLAIKAIQKQEICSIRQAARHFNVPLTTLQHRLNGHTMRAETRANNHKLSSNEEYSLLQWILSMDQHGAAPRPAAV